MVDFQGHEWGLLVVMKLLAAAGGSGPRDTRLEAESFMVLSCRFTTVVF